MGIIEAAMSRSRTVILSLLVVLVGGLIAYNTIPKEAEPDIEIPIIHVHISHDGISPDDAERLLVRPMEQELRSIEGIKEMTASAFEGGANVTLEFDAGVNTDNALQDVREKVDKAKAKLPGRCQTSRRKSTPAPRCLGWNQRYFPMVHSSYHRKTCSQS